MISREDKVFRSDGAERAKQQACLQEWVDNASASQCGDVRRAASLSGLSGTQAHSDLCLARPLLARPTSAPSADTLDTASGRRLSHSPPAFLRFGASSSTGTSTAVQQHNNHGNRQRGGNRQQGRQRPGALPNRGRTRYGPHNMPPFMRQFPDGLLPLPRLLRPPMRPQFGLPPYSRMFAPMRPPLAFMNSPFHRHAPEQQHYRGAPLNPLEHYRGAPVQRRLPRFAMHSPAEKQLMKNQNEGRRQTSGVQRRNAAGSMSFHLQELARRQQAQAQNGNNAPQLRQQQQRTPRKVNAQHQQHDMPGLVNHTPPVYTGHHAPMSAASCAALYRGQPVQIATSVTATYAGATTPSSYMNNTSGFSSNGSSNGYHQQQNGRKPYHNNNNSIQGTSSDYRSMSSPDASPQSRPHSNTQLHSKTNLYIRGLPEDTDDKKLRELCDGYGKIMSTKAIMDKETGACKGYGFVDFAEADDAACAIEELQKRNIDASLAKQQEQDPTNLYIANLPLQWEEADLEKLFCEYSEAIVSTRVLRYPNSNQSRGVGFVRMTTSDQCEDLVKKFNGQTPPECKNPLLIKFADSQKKNRSRNGYHNDGFNDSTGFGSQNGCTPNSTPLPSANGHSSLSLMNGSSTPNVASALGAPAMAYNQATLAAYHNARMGMAAGMQSYMPATQQNAQQPFAYFNYAVPSTVGVAPTAPPSAVYPAMYQQAVPPVSAEQQQMAAVNSLTQNITALQIAQPLPGQTMPLTINPAATLAHHQMAYAPSLYAPAANYYQYYPMVTAATAAMGTGEMNGMHQPQPNGYDVNQNSMDATVTSMAQHSYAAAAAQQTPFGQQAAAATA